MTLCLPFRFYGRIAEEPDAHEHDTLVAIKENGAGLAHISGERIWVELKKIFTGRHAASNVRTILACGLAPHIGTYFTSESTAKYNVWVQSLGIFFFCAGGGYHSST